MAYVRNGTEIQENPNGTYTVTSPGITGTQTLGNPNGDSIVQSSSDDAISKLAEQLGIKLNDESKDYLYNYFFNEQSRKNAWNDSVFAAKNQYQWLVDDLKKAGLNPFLAMSGMNAAGASSSGQGVSGGSIVSRKNNQATNQKDMLKAILTGLVSIIGIAIMAA